MERTNTQFIFVPELCPEQFEDEEEFLFHQSICLRLARSLEDSMKPDAVTHAHEEVWGRLRETYFASIRIRPIMNTTRNFAKSM